MMVKFSILFGLLISAINCINGQISECMTPDNITGTCVKVDSCETILTILRNISRPFPKETIIFLKKSQCGFENTIPKVCCPSSPNKSANANDSKISNLLPTDCGHSYTDRLIGEIITDLDEFSWNALLKYNKPSGFDFHCGGALINNRYVLTAAHCVQGNKLPKDWTLSEVRLGEHDISTDPDCIQYINDCAESPIDVRIEQIIVHELYNASDKIQTNDIALLRLADEVKFTDFISPMCLPINGHIRKYSHESAIIAGWGKTIEENNSNYKQKMKATLSIMNQISCAELYKSTEIKIGVGHICVNDTYNANKCYGDSGGSLIKMEREDFDYKYYAIGIENISSRNCTSADTPQVFTKVSEYGNWILNNLKP